VNFCQAIWFLSNQIKQTVSKIAETNSFRAGMTLRRINISMLLSDKRIKTIQLKFDNGKAGIEKTKAIAEKGFVYELPIVMNPIKL
jgi:hypothetical protein